MKEKEIEAYLVKRVEELGGLTRKVRWIGRRGCPDRVVFLYGKTIWVELKTARGLLSDCQITEAAQLRGHGSVVNVCRSILDADTILREWPL